MTPTRLCIPVNFPDVPVDKDVKASLDEDVDDPISTWLESQ